MKKWLLLLVLVSSVTYAKNVMHLFNWNNTISDETIKAFEAQCKCEVKATYYGSMEEMLAKLSAGAKGYDVMGPANYGITPLVKMNLLQKLDASKLTNLKNIDPKFMNTVADPGNQYSVPFDFSVTLVGYNQNKVKELGLDPTSWAIVFDPEVLAKIKGRVTVLDDPREVIAAALRYHGFSANSTDSAELKQATDTIKAAKPYWAAFNSQSYIRELAVGNIWVVLGYSNDLYQAKSDAKKAKRAFSIDYTLQKEGNGMTADSFVIAKDAPNPALAYQFINFMLEGKNAAQITNNMGAGMPNRAALPFVRQELKSVPAIVPNAQQSAKLEQLVDLGPKTRRAWNNAWTEIKLGK